MKNPRAIAAVSCLLIIDEDMPLDAAIVKNTQTLEPQDKAYVQEIIYGVCRWYYPLQKISQELLKKPLRNKDRSVFFLLLVGIYQIHFLNTPVHAAVSETVNACVELKKPWAKQLINACLRKVLRENPTQNINFVAKETFPSWMQDRISHTWGKYAEEIFQASVEKPPLCLRVNTRQFSRDDYLLLLEEKGICAHLDTYSAQGIILSKPMDVKLLPYFEKGAVSVQDSAAQLVTSILDVCDGQQVLDACAAPGGKSAHIGEQHQVHLTAIDVSQKRCVMLKQTLNRLHIDAKIYQADASDLSQWSQPEKGYDRILLDAPCSGLGVIRRHPDIKLHRTPEDIQHVTQQQYALLTQLWKCLAIQGKLLYVTCSILPEENQQIITKFIRNTPYCEVLPISHPNAIPQIHGVQSLPGVHSMDGFYYALLQKKP